MAEGQNIIQRPGKTERIVLRAGKGEEIAFAFAPEQADLEAYKEGDDLRLDLAEGGQIIIQEFFLHPDLNVSFQGTRSMTPNDFLASLDLNARPAAGQLSGNGLGAYLDDAGELIQGLEALGAGGGAEVKAALATGGGADLGGSAGPVVAGGGTGPGPGDPGGGTGPGPGDPGGGTGPDPGDPGGGTGPGPGDPGGDPGPGPGDPGGGPGPGPGDPGGDPGGGTGPGPGDPGGGTGPGPGDPGGGTGPGPGDPGGDPGPGPGDPGGTGPGDPGGGTGPGPGDPGGETGPGPGDPGGGTGPGPGDPGGGPGPGPGDPGGGTGPGPGDPGGGTGPGPGDPGGDPGPGPGDPGGGPDPDPGGGTGPGPGDPGGGPGTGPGDPGGGTGPGPGDPGGGPGPDPGDPGGGTAPGPGDPGGDPGGGTGPGPGDPGGDPGGGTGPGPGDPGGGAGPGPGDPGGGAGPGPVTPQEASLREDALASAPATRVTLDMSGAAEYDPGATRLDWNLDALNRASLQAALPGAAVYAPVLWSREGDSLLGRINGEEALRLDPVFEGGFFSGKVEITLSGVFQHEASGPLDDTLPLDFSFSQVGGNGQAREGRIRLEIMDSEPQAQDQALSFRQGEADDAVDARGNFLTEAQAASPDPLRVTELSYTAPDGSTVSLRPAPGAPVSLDLGNGATLTLESDGSYRLTGADLDGSLEQLPPLRLSVTDTDGDTASMQVSLNIRDAAPQAAGNSYAAQGAGQQAELSSTLDLSAAGIQRAGNVLHSDNGTFVATSGSTNAGGPDMQVINLSGGNYPRPDYGAVEDELRAKYGSSPDLSGAGNNSGLYLWSAGHPRHMLNTLGMTDRDLVEAYNKVPELPNMSTDDITAQGSSGNFNACGARKDFTSQGGDVVIGWDFFIGSNTAVGTKTPSTIMWILADSKGNVTQGTLCSEISCNHMLSGASAIAIPPSSEEISYSLYILGLGDLNKGTQPKLIINDILLLDGGGLPVYAGNVIEDEFLGDKDSALDAALVHSVTFNGQTKEIGAAGFARFDSKEGALEVHADGSFSFTPSGQGYAGGHFLYTLEDQDGDRSSPALVTLQASDGTGGNLVHGTEQNDTLDQSASSKDLLMQGGAGDDTLLGGSGKDTIDAGSGDDLVHGGAGDDLILGGAGKDTLYGDAGQDSIYGGAGDDLILGGKGDDVLSGGTGNDVFAWSSSDLGGVDKILDFDLDEDKLFFEGLFNGQGAINIRDLLADQTLSLNMHSASNLELTYKDGKGAAQTVSMELNEANHEAYNNINQGNASAAEEAKAALLQQILLDTM